MKVSLESVDLEATKGDIASQPDLEAVVNAANAQLRSGSGVAGAIHRAAGPELAEAGRKHAPVEPGEAVVTPAFNLPNSSVIHCLGPVYGRDKPEDKLLASCYREALDLAEQNNLESVGFPAISTGAFGYPFEEAADVVVNTVGEQLEELKVVKLIKFVLFDTRTLDIYSSKLKNWEEKLSG